MHQPTRDQVDWPQPFWHEEYVDRQARVREAMARGGLSGLLVSSPADLNYLFGYDHIWFAHDNLCVCFMPANEDAHLFFDNDGHEILVSIYPEITDCHLFGRGKVSEHVAEIAAAVAQRGWAHGKIGLQTRCYGPHPDHLRSIGARWLSEGVSLGDGSDLIEDVRLYKSPAEVDVVRKCAAIATAAMEKARDSIKEGMSETELDAIITAEMMNRGGGAPAIRTMIGGGPRAGVHHQPPSHRKFRQGDIIHIDFCASLHRYHVNCCRSFALGEVDPRWTALFERNEPMMDKIIAEVKLGDSMAKMDEVGRYFAAENDLLQYEWLIGGYSLGIAIPPDWVGRHRPRPREHIPPPKLEPGLVMNFENQYDTYKEDWESAPGAGLIDTLLMTENGFENLTPLSRKLVQVGEE